MTTGNSRQPIVVLGADHNGVHLKAAVKRLLTDAGFSCVDIGPYDEAKVDYTDFAKTVGQIVHNGDARWGVLICGTGVGMSIGANRFSNVRAALVHDLATAGKSREHNDANVLCLGAWVQPEEVNLEIARRWFAEKFGEFRHVPRVEKTKQADRAKVVFAPGIFDAVHAGHVKLLKFAKSLGGKLVVGINSDRATRELKGEGYPVNSEQDRKAVLESLDVVDEVIIFDDIKIREVIDQVRPDIVVKGGEFTADQVRERDHIPPEIEVKIYPLVPGYSTHGFFEKVSGRPKT
ncbi:MAG: RpiB/LacA/LacB family sugar-phosphate isomerase [bacterium]|nr:RpiB/LacA/LacB family sugar-phosphate isomerase [bacterium]